MIHEFHTFNYLATIFLNIFSLREYNQSLIDIILKKSDTVT